MQELKISILGLGVIGGQFLENLLRCREELEKEYQIQVKVGAIYVKNLNKKRNPCVKQEWLKDDIYKVIDAGDIVVECIGGNGCDETRDAICYALSHKKPVVMSSKKCLALYGAQFETIAQENDVQIYYDASVGGCIPISTVLENVGKCERIEEIYGICNATSNHILTEMSKKEISFQEALEHAQLLGLAENDPTEDVDGYDTLYKAVILAGFGMGYWKEPRDIKTESIRNVQPGEKKKLVFSIRNEQEESVKIDIKIREIEEGSILSTISDTNNLIAIRSSESGERFLIGKGAGAHPTASALYDDVVKIIKNYGVYSSSRNSI